MRVSVEQIREEIKERMASLRGAESAFRTDGNEQGETSARNRRQELERLQTIIEMLDI